MLTIKKTDFCVDSMICPQNAQKSVNSRAFIMLSILDAVFMCRITMLIFRAED